MARNAVILLSPGVFCAGFVGGCLGGLLVGPCHRLHACIYVPCRSCMPYNLGYTRMLQTRCCHNIGCTRFSASDTKECYSHWSTAGGPGCVSAAYYMVSILAGLDGLLPWCTMAHGHAFANCVPELYNQDAKAPSCLAHAQRLTTSCHTGTCAYVAYVWGKRRFEAAQRACSTPASQSIGAAVANGALSHIRKHVVLARTSWVAVLSFAW
jgi:hypothetical protein